MTTQGPFQNNRGANRQTDRTITENTHENNNDNKELITSFREIDMKDERL